MCKRLCYIILQCLAVICIRLDCTLKVVLYEMPFVRECGAPVRKLVPHVVDEVAGHVFPFLRLTTQDLGGCIRPQFTSVIR